MSKGLQEASKYIKETFNLQEDYQRNVEIEKIDGVLCVVDDDTGRVLFTVDGSSKQDVLNSFYEWCSEFYSQYGISPF